ncbi:phosphodiester glycosidase family protein [Gracilimonas tropica]|uniref:phosphodiester glycosidase family protein n=1 Tax=Gracilimonas tropica TaxID=454600 RepID=UPI0003660C2F|nr:phosphodiester glycosidase family protein [Gracilimonas tropica]
MKKTILFTALLIFFVNQPNLFSQSITWTEKTNTVSLPDGVKFYEGVRETPAFKGWYFEVDLKNKNIALVPYLAKGGTEKISDFASRKNVYAAINGGFFGGDVSYSTLIQPGRVLAQNVSSLTRNSQSYPVIRSMFGIREDRSMSVDWIYHFGGGLENLFKFDAPLPYSSSNTDPLPAPEKADGLKYNDPFMGVGGGPVLVKGDSVHVSYNEEIFWGSGVGRDNADPRTAVGYTDDGKAILMVVDGRQGDVSQGVSLPELAQIMIDLGATEALNLDGGGSSQMVIEDSLVNRPNGSTFQRSLATFLAIVPSDSIPEIPIVGFEQIIDTGDDSASVSEGWSESANSGYYGDTPSLITLGGDGSKTVAFNANLPQANLYELYGWWVSSFNRSKKAAYVVLHANGRDTVFADQSTDNSQWVKLGEFEFTGTNSDKVIISNTGGDVNNYIVADAIRFVAAKKEPTSNEEEYLIVPEGFKLLPSYPNPFNPNTTISYQIPEAGKISLKIFDVTGRLISTLVDGSQNPGTFQYSWNAKNMSSGIYLIKLEYATATNRWIRTQKVTLIK